MQPRLRIPRLDIYDVPTTLNIFVILFSDLSRWSNSSNALHAPLIPVLFPLFSQVHLLHKKIPLCAGTTSFLI